MGEKKSSNIFRTPADLYIVQDGAKLEFDKHAISWQLVQRKQTQCHVILHLGLKNKTHAQQRFIYAVTLTFGRPAHSELQLLAINGQCNERNHQVCSNLCSDTPVNLM